jgi:hypothetical protein
MTALLNGCKKKVKIEKVTVNCQDVKAGSSMYKESIMNEKSIMNNESSQDRKFLQSRWKQSRWLKNAEEERVKNGTVPASMHDVEPPWDKGKELSLLKYNEMIVASLSFKINELREKNVASCAKYDAENKNMGLEMVKIVACTT